MGKTLACLRPVMHLISALRTLQPVLCRSEDIPGLIHTALGVLFFELNELGDYFSLVVRRLDDTDNPSTVADINLGKPFSLGFSDGLGTLGNLSC